MLNELQLTQWIDENKELIEESCKNKIAFISLTKLINKYLNEFEDKKILYEKIEKEIWKDQNIYCASILKNGKIAVCQKDMVISDSEDSEEVTEKDLIERICTNESTFNDFIDKLFNCIDNKKEKQTHFYEIIEKKIREHEKIKKEEDLFRCIPEKYHEWIKSHQNLIKEACYIKKMYKQLIQEISDYCNHQVDDIKELYEVIEKGLWKTQNIYEVCFQTGENIFYNIYEKTYLYFSQEEEKEEENDNENNEFNRIPKLYYQWIKDHQWLIDEACTWEDSFDKLIEEILAYSDQVEERRNLYDIISIKYWKDKSVYGALFLDDGTVAQCKLDKYDF